MNSLYVCLEELTDKRKARGMRYQLVTILVMRIMAKLSGEDTPSGIAEWVKHRAQILKLKRIGKQRSYRWMARCYEGRWTRTRYLTNV